MRSVHRLSKVLGVLIFLISANVIAAPVTPSDFLPSTDGSHEGDYTVGEIKLIYTQEFAGGMGHALGFSVPLTRNIPYHFGSVGINFLVTTQGGRSYSGCMSYTPVYQSNTAVLNSPVNIPSLAIYDTPHTIQAFVTPMGCGGTKSILMSNILTKEFDLLAPIPGFDLGISKVEFSQSGSPLKKNSEGRMIADPSKTVRVRITLNLTEPPPLPFVTTLFAGIDRFRIGSDFVDSTEIPVGDTVYDYEFNPSMKANLASFETVTVQFNSSRQFSESDYSNNYRTFELQFSGNIDPVDPEDPEEPEDPPVMGLPILNSAEGEIACTHSYVDIDTLSLNEDIPLLGSPFKLYYSSARFRAGFPFSMKNLGLGGWSPSLVHRYDVENKVIYFGYGGQRPVEAGTRNGFYFLTDDAGSEMYMFDLNGMHVQTLDAITGFVKFDISYTNDGKIQGIADRFGNTSSFHYSNGQVTISNPYGQNSVAFVNENGLLESVTNPNNETYSIGYNEQGFLQNFTKPMGQTSVVTYDSAGFVTRDTGAGGDFKSFERIFDVDTGTQTVRMSTALGSEITYQTSATFEGARRYTTKLNGEQEDVEILNNYSTSKSRQDGHASVSSLLPDPRFGWMAPYQGVVQNYVRNSNINIVVDVNKESSVQYGDDPLGPRLMKTTSILQADTSRKYVTSYNSQNRTMASISPMNRTMTQVLNQQGLLASSAVANLEPVKFIYDSRGRISSVAQKDQKVSFTYDDRGNVATSKDPLGRVTSYSYDLSNRLISKVAPDGGKTVFAFDKNGNMTSITPPGKTAHEFTYNLMELVSSYLPPKVAAISTGVAQYSYDQDMRLAEISKPMANNISFNYAGGVDLVSSYNTSEGTYTVDYKDYTNQIRRWHSPMGIDLEYEYAGTYPTKVKATGLINSTLGYSYNSDATLSTLSVSTNLGSGSSMAYRYDKDALLIGVGNQSMTRNNFGAISSVSLKNINQTMAYDSMGQLISEKYVKGTKILSEKIYTRDFAGRIKKIAYRGNIFGSLNKSFEYDSAGRLSKVLLNGLPISSYKYDQNGNRLQVDNLGIKVNAVYDSQDRLLTFGYNQFVYNKNGELVEKFNRTTLPFFLRLLFATGRSQYQYDSFGNLRGAVLSDGTKVDYILDAQGRRVGKRVKGKIVQGFVYLSQTQIAAELDASGKIVKQFVYGSKPNIPDYMIYKNREYRIISDHVGTPEIVVDAQTGEILDRLIFDDFGVKISGTSILPFGFAGGLYDAHTKLTHFGAREYDAEAGRWTSKDPIGFGGGDTNLYGYVANDPVNWIDPTGLKVGDWWDLPANYGRSREIANEEYANWAGNHNNWGDAMRHYEWSRRTTAETNSFTAFTAGWGHEIESFFRRGNMPALQYLRESWMDVHNNALGRDSGRSGSLMCPSNLSTQPGSGGY